MMDKAEADSARDHIAKAAEIIDGHGTFRLRVLMQMVLAEIEKERARASAALKPQPAGP